MDGDEDLLAAVSAGAAFALVRVSSLTREKAGTRGQVAGYDCHLLRAIEGAWVEPVSLRHYGVPLLAAGQSYLVGAIDNRRHHGGWEVRFAALAEGSLDDLVAAFLTRRAAVGTAGG
jgi:hypothetical protein